MTWEDAEADEALGVAIKAKGPLRGRGHGERSPPTMWRRREGARTGRCGLTRRRARRRRPTVLLSPRHSAERITEPERCTVTTGDEGRPLS